MSQKKNVRSEILAALTVFGALVALGLLPACGKNAAPASSGLFPSSLGFSQPAAVK